MAAKSFLLIAVALISLCFGKTHAAEPPDGFAGIAWGVSKDAVKSEMLKRIGVTESRNKSPGRLEFVGGVFAERHVQVWGLEFTSDNRFARGAALLKPTTDRDKGFAALKQEITSKYGQPTSNARKGDDVKVTWRFSSSEQIVIELSNEAADRSPKIIYRNEGMLATSSGKPKDL